jgi:hypothetical protein
MSVTFWADGAPTHRVTPYPDEPDFQCEEPVAPFFEINLANSNARDILELLYPKATEELFGKWGKQELTEVLDAIARTRASTAATAALTEPTFVSLGDKGAMFVECGRSLRYVQDRLDQLHRLCTLAQQHGYPVCFG